jgi:hypothetical protein
METTPSKKRKEMEKNSESVINDEPVFSSPDEEVKYWKSRAEKAEMQLHKIKTSTKETDQNDTETDEDEVDPVANSNDPWMVMYQQMREFRIINGHCRVPMKFAENPKLGWWVANQRKSRKGSGSTKRMTPERIALLDAIDFVWGKDSNPVPWESRYQELVKYHQTVGHCDIPFHPTSPSTLATWCAAQRTEYRRFQKGSDTMLTLEQIGKLNEINFSWKANRTKK